MAKKDKFNLPGSSYEIIVKILSAYALCGKGKVSLNDVASKSGMGKTAISRNNAFFVSIGILEGGKNKQLTETGGKLALALSNNIDEDISKYWREILFQCKETNSVIDMVVIQKKISKDNIIPKVASSIGMVVSSTTKTGINALIDLFEKAEILEIEDGQYHVIDGIRNTEISDKSPINGNKHFENSQSQIAMETSINEKHGNSLKQPSIHIDLEIHISPESTLEQIDKVFESIAKHLYGRHDKK
jgi:hypothetical protein